MRYMNHEYASTEDVTRAEIAEREARRDRDAWLWLMASPHGRRIARSLIGQSGVLRRAAGGDALLLSFREGQRSIGFAVMDAARQHAPEQYPHLFKDEPHA